MNANHQPNIAILAESPALRRGLGSAWMIVAALLFALMGVFVKQGAQSFTPVELVFWRTLFGVLMLGIPARLHGQRFVTPHLKVHLIRGCAGYVALLLTFYAMAHLPLATAITLNYTSPMFLALLSVLWLKERFSGRMAAALALGFVGVTLLLRPALGGICGSTAWWGWHPAPRSGSLMCMYVSWANSASRNGG